MKQLICLLIALVFVSTAGASVNNNCLQVRSGIDVGSGTTKLKVAKVDICRKMVVQVLAERREPVGLKEDCSLTKNFSDKIKTKLKDTLKSYKELSLSYGAKSIRAVATAAFRIAKNGEELANDIRKNVGMDFRIIDQDEEARLGYIAGSAYADKSMGPVVVWDIGGGSYQFSTLKDGKLVTSVGQMGAVPFKELVIEKIKKQSKSKVRTPNPLSEDQILQASLLSAIDARNAVSKFFKDLLEKKTTQVLGIGGVHAYSIKGQVKPEDDYISIDSLRETLSKRSGLKDEQIESKYADTEISNLSLVYGMMEGLLIDKFKVAKVNLADALCIEN